MPVVVRKHWKCDAYQPLAGTLCPCVFVTGIVHENGKGTAMGSDGESDPASGTSSDEVQSPVRVRLRNGNHRRIAEVAACLCTRHISPLKIQCRFIENFFKVVFIYLFLYKHVFPSFQGIQYRFQSPPYWN